MNNCNNCAANRITNAKCKFCKIVCKSENCRYFINENWTFKHPKAALIDKMIVNYYEINGKEKTFEMLKMIGFSQNPTFETIQRRIDFCNM